MKFGSLLASSIFVVPFFCVYTKATDEPSESNGWLWRRPVNYNTGKETPDKTTDIIKPQHVAKGTSQEKSFLDSVRMPGTNWCGKGWRTDSLYKLGGYTSADRCCRQHDLGCPISIQPAETKYGLTNIRVHTVMHCTCDDRFRSCLKMSRSAPGQIVANLFFNILNIPCFVFSKKEVCTARSWWGSCLNTKVVKKAVWRKALPF